MIDIIPVIGLSGIAFRVDGAYDAHSLATCRHNTLGRSH